ncbi:MAG: fumarylacetoacetate hydrolase family protein [bacterium]|nr:fumarylacetoacetate hydrolase family protein [bacterium]
MKTLSPTGLIKVHGTRYLIDTLGFEKHMRQVRARRGDTVPPVWYKRPSMYGLHLERDKIQGTDEILKIPSFVEKPDYEFEIVAFFTESIKTTSITEAIAFVKTKMLFTIMNDMSARDHQAEDMLLPLWVGPSKGILPKSFGPHFVHGSVLNFDENGVPDIPMRLFVNNTPRCDDNFRSIYFNDPETGAKKCWGFAQVITWFGTKNQGFEKGGLLGSGTIGNGSIAENASYSWLQHGDNIKMEAIGIGVLENTVHTKTISV